ncbi:hypothetical protein D3C76_1298250 [compost metagenome]
MVCGSEMPTRLKLDTVSPNATNTKTQRLACTTYGRVASGSQRRNRSTPMCLPRPVEVATPKNTSVTISARATSSAHSIGLCSA